MEPRPPYYRCQIQRDDAFNNRDHPATVYVREDASCLTLTRGSASCSPRAPRRHVRQARRCRPTRHRPRSSGAPDSGPDPQARPGARHLPHNRPHRTRSRLEALLGRTPTTRLSADDIKALVASLYDIAATLAAADPADKAEVYAEMGIDITYHQDGRVVVESRPRVVESSVGERTRTSTGLHTPPGP